MSRFQPIYSDIPTSSDINKMTLQQLNESIRKFGKRENTRLLRLERYAESHMGDGEGGILAAKRLAGRSSPYHNAAGLAERFDVRPATNVQSARVRLEDIAKALRFKSSTVTGMNAIRQQRIDSISAYMRRAGILGPNQKLTGAQFDELVKVLEGLDPGYDSFTAFDIVMLNIKDGKFKNMDDLIEFINNNKTSVLIKKYEEIPDGKTVSRDRNGLFYEGEKGSKVYI